MPQPHRLTRSATLSPRAERLDWLVLPTVVLLLLLGATFVITAWSQAEDTVAASQRKDELRADRLAGAVSTIVERQWQDLNAWADVQRALTRIGLEDDLVKDLADRIESDGSAATAAWVLVRSDGRIAAVGEQEPGRIARNGISDDLTALGRRISRQDKPLVSGRLVFGDDTVYAAGVPIEPADQPPVDGAAEELVNPPQPDVVMMVRYLDRSPIGTFLGDRAKGKVDQLALVDARGRLLVGSPEFGAGADHVSRAVGDTGWKLNYTRETAQTLVPRWTYPAFAALLVAFALAYALQDIRRRRLSALGAARLREVHALYELAERMLHADTIEAQAEDLARCAIDLANVQGACVEISVVGSAVQRTSGTMSMNDHVVRVPVSAPRSAEGERSIGELVVSRAGQPLDEEERWVVQTAATLAGAAMHTLDALQAERSTAAELQRIDELRSNLLATVAHELLSPLTAVKGVLGLLSMQDDLGKKGHEYVDVATAGTDRLVALIRDLFDCSLLETGQLDIRPKRQRADELLESALGAQAAAHAGNIRLSATPNLMITVDPVRFDQLVNNLVTNALRHGAPPIEVAVRPADGGVVVMVTDEGPGVPEDLRDEIFGKFWQGSSGHARLVEGAGLGLSLVQGLVRVHGGDIEVDSTHADGRGARFTAFFPDIVPGHATPGIDEQDRPAVA